MNKHLITIIAYGATALLAIAQDKPLVDPPELAAMRQEHLRAMQRVSIPALSAYARQLDAQKAAFSRQGKLEAAIAVDNELKEITKQLQAANGAVAQTGASLQLTIVQAMYGHAPSKRFLNITTNLRKAMDSGAASIKLNDDEAGGKKDPAPYAPKDTTITYTINGERKQKTFPEGYNLNFKEDLQ